MKKKWICVFILINAAILFGSIFCLIMTGQNVRFINQGNASVACKAKDNLLTVTLADGKEFELIFANNSVKIKDSYKAGKSDCMALALAIRSFSEEVGIAITRTNSEIYGELRLHEMLYSLGIARDHTRDCDVDYVADPRWYINSTSKLIGWMGV